MTFSCYYFNIKKIIFVSRVLVKCPPKGGSVFGSLVVPRVKRKNEIKHIVAF